MVGGSSPRVRGKPSSGASESRAHRLIPARAGKTSHALAARGSRSAHPRACGENALAARTAVATSGSSPRVRGKHSGRPRRHPQRRLIPARAGKTGVPPIRPETNRAHPRACGENHQESARMRVERGSSPRVRGKLRYRADVEDRRGLIPARAGKTHIPEMYVYSVAAHPRACGENDNVVPVVISRLGSSPRVRGKPQVGESAKDDDGLIPARAGKTDRST